MPMTTKNTDSGAETAPEMPPGFVIVPDDSEQEGVLAPERSGGSPGTLQDGGSAVPAPAASPAKRGPGKPKGLPKSGGRTKGTPNRSTVQTRERIQELADPIAFLADVMAGKRMVAAGEPGGMKKTWCYPSLEQRLRAGETLLRKILPDLKATELSGPDGAPLIEPTPRDKHLSTLEAARHIAFVLDKAARGTDAKMKLDKMGAAEIDADAEGELRRDCAARGHDQSCSCGR